MTELWKEIPGWEGYYQASNLGQVCSMNREVQKKNKAGKICSYKLSGKVLRPKWHQKYARVTLTKNNQPKSYTVHKLIALTWLGECPLGLQVLHGIYGHTNNEVENLSYGTASKNSLQRAAESTFVGKQIRKQPVVRSDGKVFDSITEAALYMGCDRSSISMCCSGRLESVVGYVWRRV